MKLLATQLLTCWSVSACTGLQGGDEHDGNDPDGAANVPTDFCDAMVHLTGASELRIRQLSVTGQFGEPGGAFGGTVVHDSGVSR